MIKDFCHVFHVVNERYNINKLIDYNGEYVDFRTLNFKSIIDDIFTSYYPPHENPIYVYEFYNKEEAEEFIKRNKEYGFYNNEYREWYDKNIISFSFKIELSKADNIWYYSLFYDDDIKSIEKYNNYDIIINKCNLYSKPISDTSQYVDQIMFNFNKYYNLGEYEISLRYLNRLPKDKYRLERACLENKLKRVDL